MTRLTYYDDLIHGYSFKDGQNISLSDIVDYIGELEDYFEGYKEAPSAPLRFGEYLKNLRERLHFTQEQFANAIHVSRSNIANYETGKCKVPNQILISIAVHIDGITYEELKKALRKIEGGVDDDVLNKLIFDMTGYNAIAKEISRLIEFERKYAKIKKRDLASAIGILQQTHLEKSRAVKKYLLW